LPRATAYLVSRSLYILSECYYHPMLSKLFRQLKTKKTIQFRDWYSNPRLAQSGAGGWISYTR
jgi:hypothetical protein